MGDPWLDDIAKEHANNPRSGGCGCGTKTKLLLVSLLLAVVVLVALGKMLVTRYEDRQQQEAIKTRIVIPPPRATPVIVPPASGVRMRPTPICTPSAARPKG